MGINDFDPIDYLKDKNHHQVKVVPSVELVLDPIEDIPPPICDQDYAEWKRQAVTRIRKVIWDELSVGKTIDDSAHDWLQQFILGFAKHL